MTVNQLAQTKAPSYYFMPEDGALFTCSLCGQRKAAVVMIKVFTPDEKVHFAQCLDCTDGFWFERATRLDLNALEKQVRAYRGG